LQPAIKGLPQSPPAKPFCRESSVSINSEHAADLRDHPAGGFTGFMYGLLNGPLLQYPNPCCEYLHLPSETCADRTGHILLAGYQH
jgi:hypothetical protein